MEVAVQDTDRAPDRQRPGSKQHVVTGLRGMKSHQSARSKDDEGASTSRRRKSPRIEKKEAQRPQPTNTPALPSESETDTIEEVPNIELKRGTGFNSRSRQGSGAEDWLEESSWACTVPAGDRPQVPQTPSDDEDRSQPSSTETEDSMKTSASVTDSVYYNHLFLRNILIESTVPNPELMRRAKAIISRQRKGPKINDGSIQEIMTISRTTRWGSEQTVVQDLASHIIPNIATDPQELLACTRNAPWSDQVPVPLIESFQINPLPLPLPKPVPDGLYGYSMTTFTPNQLEAVLLLRDKETGGSYAVPDQRTIFPFLTVEFKSQACGGTHHVALNQAAGAGAIALNGNIQLMQRSLGIEQFDYNEPQFFSFIMDHEIARINVHWVEAPGQGEALHKFHVENLALYHLRNPEHVRHVIQAVGNILDYGRTDRLPSIRNALEVYRENVFGSSTQRSEVTTDSDGVARRSQRRPFKG